MKIVARGFDSTLSGTERRRGSFPRGEVAAVFGFAFVGVEGLTSAASVGVPRPAPTHAAAAPSPERSRTTTAAHDTKRTRPRAERRRPRGRDTLPSALRTVSAAFATGTANSRFAVARDSPPANAAPNSSMVAKRFAGAFDSAREIAATMDGGASGRRLARSGGAALM